MKKTVITYGTFDLFHEGHFKILERCKKIGNKLIVGVTGKNYDLSRGKLNVVQSIEERIENVKKSGLADQIIIEDYQGQKIDDIIKYNVDIFGIGDDWIGKFDYLEEYCEVVYFERTRNISSTILREKNFNILKLGIVGTGRIASRFIQESKYVSGINVESVYSRNQNRANEFVKKFELNAGFDDFTSFLASVDCVYIATEHERHFELAKLALVAKKHVLVEKPICLDLKEVEELINISKNNNLVLMEAIKTAYAPAFIKLMEIVKSGVLGKIIDISATFTKLISNNSLRELQDNNFGGSFLELGSYLLLPSIKLLDNIEEFKVYTIKENNVDVFCKICSIHSKGFSTLTAGLKVKKEGSLVISGTKGYIYVPAPWWKTSEFEIRFEDINLNKKYFYAFDEDGLRYEIAEFIECIRKNKNESDLYNHQEIIKINKSLSDIKHNINKIDSFKVEL